jgi:chaperone required for assembly of F1-ATPase
VKRFYREVSHEPVAGRWRVLLDGRPVRTQGGNAQIVPTEALAAALAAEWRDQDEEIDPSRFRLRDMADYAIDQVAANREGIVAELLGYAGTDTLCYRADPDEALYRHQRDEWEPILTTFEAREGVRFERASGIVHRAQPEETMERLGARLATLDDFTLAALQPMTALAASLVIALSALEPDADADGLWRAASLEEEWQADLWGRDEAAEARRARRREDFTAACDFARLARPHRA